jgi:tRNA G18 (ribose-2'-O)-methylase SpoU
MTQKYNAKELRALAVEGDLTAVKEAIDRKPIYIILDDVLDTYNIGSVFRLADAVAASEVLLCAGSETPPNHRIKKASINTTEWVDWKYFPTAVDAIKNLRERVPDIKVVAIEQTEGSVAFDQFDYSYPVAFVVGHETTGVHPETLQIVDATVELPMYGVNISLNVMVSLGIVLYHSITARRR